MEIRDSSMIGKKLLEINTVSSDIILANKGPLDMSGPYHKHAMR